MLHERESNYLKALLEKGLYSSSKGQLYAPTTPADAETIDSVQNMLNENATARLLQEQQQMIAMEQQQNLSKIKNLRQLTINKLINDKKTVRPNSSTYRREIKINGGRLKLSYISSGLDYLDIVFADKGISNSVTVGAKGDFRNTISNTKPDHTTQALHHELNDNIPNENPATPDIILGVANLMNLYLQTDVAHKSFVQNLFHRSF